MQHGLTLNAVEWPGHRVEYVETGQGPALILIHGGLCSADDWANIVPELSRDYRLILPDGLVHPLDPWAIWCLLDHLHVQTACLLGHSAGGATARAMYRLAPERVRGLIMVDAGGAVRPGAMQLARNLPNSLFSEQAAALYEKNRAAMEALAERHRGDYPSDVTIACRSRAYARAGLSPEEIAATEGRSQPKGTRLPGNPPPPPTPISEEGKFMECPVQIYQTGRGKMGPADISPAWIEDNVQAHDVDYHVIKEAGHWMWMEDPNLLLDRLKPFLRTTLHHSDL